MAGSDFMAPNDGAPWSAQQAREHLERSRKALNAYDLATLDECRRLAAAMLPADSPYLTVLFNPEAWMVLEDEDRDELLVWWATATARWRTRHLARQLKKSR